MFLLDEIGLWIEWALRIPFDHLQDVISQPGLR
jgi:hypothetical protein